MPNLALTIGARAPPLIYTHLIRFSDEEYTSAVARTVDDARKLIDARFEYVTEIDGVKIFRRRK